MTRRLVGQILGPIQRLAGYSRWAPTRVGGARSTTSPRRRTSMASFMLIRHKVRDFPEWKRGYDAHLPKRVEAPSVLLTSEILASRDDFHVMPRRG